MRDRRIRGLDGLRALCALFILWSHVAQNDFCKWEIEFIPVPECCAYVFFAISGLLAGYRIDETNSNRSYYKKKAQRLLPLYYSYIVVSILVYSILGQTDQVFENGLFYYLFLIPQVPFCTKTALLPFVHLWFVGVIVLFYFLFPFFARFKVNKRKTEALCLAIAWLLIKLVLRVFFGSGSILYKLVSVTSFDVLFIGVWVGLLIKEDNRMLEKLKNYYSLGLFAGLLFLCSGLYGSLIPAPVRMDFIAILALVFIVFQQKELPFPNLENRFLNWLGSISYEIYVTQILVIILLSEAYSKAGIVFPSLVIYMICTAIVIGVAWCFHEAINLLNLSRFKANG